MTLSVVAHSASLSAILSLPNVSNGSRLNYIKFKLSIRPLKY